MIRTASIILIAHCFFLPSTVFGLQDQGLASVLSIIDKAIEDYDKQVEEGADTGEASQQTTPKVVSLSRTLGKLSYSRLQCGEADVLAEFTQRVQKLPQDFRDPMRDAFQQGFDQSKDETPLLSEDECERLTQSRNVGDKKVEANVKEEGEKRDEDKKAEVKEEVPVDPRLTHMRLAELSGQLAFKRKFCGDNKVVTRDFNEVIGKMPEEYQEEAKNAYWTGYKHGRRLNKGLNKEQCL